MRKINLELGRINKGMRLKFSLILDSPSQNKKLDTFSHFHIDGNDYYKINPHPFITIDIAESYDKNEAWSANKSVTLNQLGKMTFENKLNIIIHNFQIKNLFYYDKSNKLIVNREIIKQLNYRPFVVGNKTCVFQYAVIPDDKSKEVEYEGVIFMINTPDNFCYLTFEELSLLHYTLKSIDMMQLTMSVLTYFNSIKNDVEDEIVTVEPQILQETFDILESPTIPLVEPANTIPDL